MRLKKSPFLIALLLCLVWINITSLVSAQAFDPVMSEAEQILETTLAIDGYLTREMHSRYWELIDSMSPEGKVDMRMIEFLQGAAKAGLAVQRELLQSAQKSWAEQRVVKSDELERLLNDFAQYFVEWSHFDANSQVHREMLRTFEIEHEQNLQLIEIMLESAAGRADKISSAYGSIPFGIELIETNISQLDEIFHRLGLLLQRDWVE